MYLLDTNTFVLFSAGESNVIRRIQENSDILWLSSVAAEELMVGRFDNLNRARRPKTSLSLSRAHETFVQTLEDMRIFPLLAYSEEAERVFLTFPASIRRYGTQDCRIAAHGIAHGLIVVTRNERDFAAIGALCEDWSA